MRPASLSKPKTRYPNGNHALAWRYDDGGRAVAGHPTDRRYGDCVCRAIAIATNLTYQEVYDDLEAGMRTQRRSKHETRNRDPDHGVNVNRKWFRDYMCELGFVWHPVGRCRRYFVQEAIPLRGRIIVLLHDHVSAVIDGVIHDTYHPAEATTAAPCVRLHGYWRLKGT